MNSLSSSLAKENDSSSFGLGQACEYVGRFEYLDVFYAGSQGALLTRYNRSNGQIRDIQVYPRFFSGEPAKALPERFIVVDGSRARKWIENKLWDELIQRIG